MFTAGAMHTLLAPVAVGASIVFARSRGEDALVEALQRLEPTYVPTSPTVLSSLLDRLGRQAQVTPAALRYVRSSSSALSTALQDRVELALGVPVVQGYGMTEVGPIAQNPLPPARRKARSVGISVGPEIAILDEKGTFCGPPAVGEIVVRGPGVMSGYEDDVEANRNAFHEGWFRTGDSGYLDEDGYLFITGRIKELVNRGGIKVSPAEVDEALLRHPAVLDAATFGAPHPTLGEDVAAVVVVRDHAEVSTRHLREFALEQLAAYKVPSTITIVASLPRNAAGKLNRSALAKSLSKSPRRNFVAPRNEHEERVAAIFADVLGVERVGVEDNFFELGGDSLRGVQVIARANRAFGASVGAESLFRWPTVEELRSFPRIGRAGEAGKAAARATR